MITLTTIDDLCWSCSVVRARPLVYTKECQVLSHATITQTEWNARYPDDMPMAVPFIITKRLKTPALHDQEGHHES